MQNRQPQSYQISVGGRLGQTMRAAFPALQARTRGDDTVIGRPGDFFAAPPGTRHGFRPANDRPARVLNMHAPDAGFAADEEFVELAQHAAEKGMTPDEIKRAIKNWRPDTYRV